jgi:hypothetical protein
LTNRRSCPSPWVDCSVETGGPPTHRPAPGRSVGCMKPVLWYVLYRRLECLADSLRRSILWAEPAKGVSQFGQTDRGMVAQTIGKQPIDLNRRSTLQHIQVDTGIQKQRPPIAGSSATQGRSLSARPLSVLVCFWGLTTGGFRKDQIPRSISAGMLPFRPTKRAPKSSSMAKRDSASSNNSVSDVTWARFLAASINSEDTRPERRVFFAAPRSPAAFACSSTSLLPLQPLLRFLRQSLFAQPSEAPVLNRI